MTDRELLELAAKAAEITLWDWSEVSQAYRTTKPMHDWNPLTDDGDALRLAVKLGVDVFGSSHYRMCEWDEGVATEPSNNDPYAATRRAIVRAAAEIGKGMK